MNLWGDEETAKLIRYMNLNMKRKDIAKELSRTTNQVIGKVDRLRKAGVLPMTNDPKVKRLADERWDSTDVMFLKNYLRKGFAISAVARIMRRSKKDVIDKIDSLRANGNL